MNVKGFTLLEVTLFLAITAALVVIAVVGLGPRLRNLRFTQAVRSIETSLTKNFIGSEAGVNSRTTNITCQKSGSVILIETSATQQKVGGSSECVRNGKVAIFQSGSDQRIVYRNIVSLVTPASASAACGSFAQLISVDCYRPTILNNTQEMSTVYQYANELEQQSNNKLVGYLQHPETGEKHYFYSESNDGFTKLVAEITPVVTPSASTELCYSLRGRVAKLIFKNTSSKPELKFEGLCS